ncbi:MAG TPA: hypothetical protein VL460_05560 [Caulobacteraceae bacterium]|jgi:hypothetical protein|nr:hypothetical protein [Caulobacteraceae bacterium]
MIRRPSGFQQVIGRAASLAVALLAVLTLVASGASHELLHADEGPSPVAHAAWATATHVVGLSEKAPQHRSTPAHGCSGHCVAHAADQAPILTLLPAPRERHAGWRLEARAALPQFPTAGPERPPRA